jgi:electron transport complex protein RnfD
MVLPQITSPHISGANRTGQLMLWVILATLPALALQTYWYGYGNLINVILAALMAITMEAAIIRIRRRPVVFYLADNSALLTAVLLGLALPPFSPWWLLLIAVLSAIVFAKHLYGGLGNNPFNPAMVGYALVLIAFPVEMTRWATAGIDLSMADSLRITFMGFSDANGIDSWTHATPLDIVKHKGAQPIDALIASPEMGQGLKAAYWVNFAYAIGGSMLLCLRIISWHAPVAMLTSLALISSVFYLVDPQKYPSSLMHLLTGATIMGAFFIITDPVSSATSRLGKLFYGAAIGILVYVIRTFGSYPEAMAFSVLLMNLAAPFIDYYTRPRSYGHQSSWWR